MTNGRWLTAAATVVLFAGIAMSALAGDGQGGDGNRGDGRARHAARHGGARRGGMRKAMRHHRGRMLKFLSSLQFTDAQRQTMLEKARAVAPIVESARADARRVIAQAWAQAAKDGAAADRKTLRESVRSQIKALREKAWTQIQPLAHDVAATLTPEQRQKLGEAAAKRGRTVDDAKLDRFAARLISRPMAVPYLEARLGVASPR